MVNCWHINQARLLITAVISVIQPTHFFNDKVDIICQVVKKRNYISDSLTQYE